MRHTGIHFDRGCCAAGQGMAAQESEIAERYVPLQGRYAASYDTVFLVPALLDSMKVHGLRHSGRSGYGIPGSCFAGFYERRGL